MYRSGAIALGVQVTARSLALRSSVLKSAVTLAPPDAMPKRARLAKCAQAGGAVCRGTTDERPTPSRDTWYDPVTWAALLVQASRLRLCQTLWVSPPLPGLVLP